MDSGLIRLALPTDEEAIEYLTSIRGEDNLKVTPLMAKSLYPDKVKSNRHFTCATKGCDAPITCRSIKETHVNQPTFVNQSRVVNLHSKHCSHHPDNKVEDRKKRPEESYAEHFDSGRTISGISRVNGFVPLTPLKQKAVDQKQRRKTLLMPEVKKEGESREKKGVVHRLRTLQQHAELFADDPDFKVINQSAGGDIPIREMFENIRSNVFYEDMLDKEKVMIYTGRAYLSETSNDKVIAVRFKDKIEVEGQAYRPSMIISRDYFMEEYEDIYEAFTNGNQYEFDVFTTLPFFMNGKYLNFSSYRTHEQINPFGEELYSNFYIR
ncbi:hypothetical protein [Salinicoccus roseus]|uniref:hypothetical protein n=1 Tax=Salinicoccus roseus TaxID=45670 RepID=UPI0022FFE099|nr:hypothetical protein [Salinicoccus roseus]